ncbi:MAG: hypothetical protein L0Z54_06330 [Thermoplasmata archaeon]|nr:hypothetical protein [Thermoplasmata archaeon]
MDPLLIASGLVAFPPAMLVFFLYLNPYYDRLREDWVFFAFVFGMFLGLLGGAFHLLVGTQNVLLIPPFDVVLLTTFLNAGRFRGKRHSVYYGLSMGIGYAAMAFIMWVVLFFERSGSSGWNVGYSFIVAIPFALMYGAIGGYLGRGSATRRPGGHGLRAILMMLPFYVFIDMLSWEGVEGAVVLAPVAGLFVYSLFLYNFTSESVLPRGMVKARSRSRSR